MHIDCIAVASILRLYISNKILRNLMSGYGIGYYVDMGSVA